MRVLFELGRLLIVDAARTASRRLSAAADMLEGAADTSDDDGSVGVLIEDGPLVSEKAAAMIARPVVEPEPSEPPPLKGSIAERGRDIGQPWAR